MGRVILGAILCGGVVLALAMQLNWDVQIDIGYRSPSGGGQATANVRPVISVMAPILLGCAAAIVGAIAGAMSALPDSKPVPLWLIWTLLVVVLVVAILGTVLMLVPRSPGPVLPGDVPAKAQATEQKVVPPAK